MHVEPQTRVETEEGIVAIAMALCVAERRTRRATASHGVRTHGAVDAVSTDVAFELLHHSGRVIATDARRVGQASFEVAAVPAVGAGVLALNRHPAQRSITPNRHARTHATQASTATRTSPATTRTDAAQTADDHAGSAPCSATDCLQLFYVQKAARAEIMMYFQFRVVGWV